MIGDFGSHFTQYECPFCASYWNHFDLAMHQLGILPIVDAAVVRHLAVATHFRCTLGVVLRDDCAVRVFVVPTWDTYLVCPL